MALVCDLLAILPDCMQATGHHQIKILLRRAQIAFLDAAGVPFFMG
jgi:hypothetical protein